MLLVPSYSPAPHDWREQGGWTWGMEVREPTTENRDSAREASGRLWLVADQPARHCANVHLADGPAVWIEREHGHTRLITPEEPEAFVRAGSG